MAKNLENYYKVIEDDSAVARAETVDGGWGEWVGPDDEAIEKEMDVVDPEVETKASSVAKAVAKIEAVDRVEKEQIAVDRAGVEAMEEDEPEVIDDIERERQIERQREIDIVIYATGIKAEELKYIELVASLSGSFDESSEVFCKKLLNIFRTFKLELTEGENKGVELPMPSVLVLLGFGEEKYTILFRNIIYKEIDLMAEAAEGSDPTINAKELKSNVQNFIDGSGLPLIFKKPWQDSGSWPAYIMDILPLLIKGTIGLLSILIKINDLYGKADIEEEEEQRSMLPFAIAELQYIVEYNRLLENVLNSRSIVSNKLKLLSLYETDFQLAGNYYVGNIPPLLSGFYDNIVIHTPLPGDRADVQLPLIYLIWNYFNIKYIIVNDPNSMQLTNYQIMAVLDGIWGGKAFTGDFEASVDEQGRAVATAAETSVDEQGRVMVTNEGGGHRKIQKGGATPSEKLIDFWSKSLVQLYGEGVFSIFPELKLVVSEDPERWALDEPITSLDDFELKLEKIVREYFIFRLSQGDIDSYINRIIEEINSVAEKFGHSPDQYSYNEETDDVCGRVCHGLNIIFDVNDVKNICDRLIVNPGSKDVDVVKDIYDQFEIRTKKLLDHTIPALMRDELKIVQVIMENPLGPTDEEMITQRKFLDGLFIRIDGSFNPKRPKAKSKPDGKISKGEIMRYLEFGDVKNITDDAARQAQLMVDLEYLRTLFSNPMKPDLDLVSKINEAIRLHLEKDAAVEAKRAAEEEAMATGSAAAKETAKSAEEARSRNATALLKQKLGEISPIILGILDDDDDGAITRGEFRKLHHSQSIIPNVVVCAKKIKQIIDADGNFVFEQLKLKFPTEDERIIMETLRGITWEEVMKLTIENIKLITNEDSMLMIEGRSPVAPSLPAAKSQTKVVEWDDWDDGDMMSTQPANPFGSPAYTIVGSPDRVDDSMKHGDPGGGGKKNKKSLRKKSTRKSLRKKSIRKKSIRKKSIRKSLRKKSIKKKIKKTPKYSKKKSIRKLSKRKSIRKLSKK